MNFFEFLLVTLSNIISLNVRDGKIKLCFTDIGAEDLMLEKRLAALMAAKKAQFQTECGQADPDGEGASKDSNSDNSAVVRS